MTPRPGEDADVRGKPDLERELAEEPVAEGVERADRGRCVPYGTSWSTRSTISSAALSVKVRARISDGFARFSAISQAIRRVMTVVLPVPAPATISSGPSPCVTALRWRAVRSASSGGWMRRCGRLARVVVGVASSSKNGS